MTTPLIILTIFVLAIFALFSYAAFKAGKELTDVLRYTNGRIDGLATDVRIGFRDLEAAQSRANLQIRETFKLSQASRSAAVMIVGLTEQGHRTLLACRAEFNDHGRAKLTIMAQRTIKVEGIFVAAPPNAICDAWSIGQNRIESGYSNFPFRPEAISAIMAVEGIQTIKVGEHMTWEISI